jgi:8-oxo-dGTP diphosphatase
MISLPIRQRIAHFIRRYPIIMATAYNVYFLVKAKQSIGAVGVVMNAEKQFLLVEHVLHPRIPWGLPGGGVGWNEDPSEAVRREILEETGLEVEMQGILHVQKTHTNHLDTAYLCKPLTTEITLSSELLNYRWTTLADIPRMHKFHYDALEIAYKRVEES